MLVLYTRKPRMILRQLKELIDNGDIRTWEHSQYNNNVTRFDWTGGDENWPNLDERVYFTMTTGYPSDPEADTIMSFKLHTKSGHRLEASDYAKIHSELLYTLMAHVSENITFIQLHNPSKAWHRADIIDRKI